MRKENLPQDEYLASVYESMLNGDTASPKKVITESNKPVVIDPNAEPTRAFNEAFDSIALDEGWFDRFAGAAKGQVAKVKTGLDNLGISGKNAYAGAKGVLTGNTVNTQKHKNPKHEQVIAKTQHILNAGLNNLISDLEKSGLIANIDKGKFSSSMRTYIKSKINDSLKQQGILTRNDELSIDPQGIVSIIGEQPQTTPITKPITKNRKQPTTPTP